MSASFPAPDPSMIGGVSAAPFVRLPDPSTLFATRAERLRFLAGTSDLGPYLGFLADLSDAQDVAGRDLPEPAQTAPERLARAKEHAMPPLDRAGFRRDAVANATLDAFFDAAKAIRMPAAAGTALAAVREASPDELDIAVGNVLADAIPIDSVAEHVFVAAALQVHFARLAAALPAAELVPVGDALCPACGGPPVASMVVGWPGAESTRYCFCPLCATAWNYVRIRCTACGSTKGIGLQTVEGGPGTAKAETCDACGSYCKVFAQDKDPAAEPVADDIASLGLDLLMRDGRYRRAAYNPFLVGY